MNITILSTDLEKSLAIMTVEAFRQLGQCIQARALQFILNKPDIFCPRQYLRTGYIINITQTKES